MVQLILFIALNILVACNFNNSQSTQIPQPKAFTTIEDLSQVRLHKGETAYVPVYSHIPMGKNQILSLKSILSLRNTSEKSHLYINRIDYFDTNGKSVRQYLKQSIRLNPMATYEVEIPESDLSGGTGANFIVQWNSENEISSPVIECLMYGSSGQHSYSFISRGQIIELR